VWLTGAAAVLCILVLPLWILGVPGIENEYARGWEIGLWVIVFYPVLWLATLAISRLLIWITERAGANDSVDSALELAAALALLGLFCLAALAMCYAFMLMT